MIRTLRAWLVFMLIATAFAACGGNEEGDGDGGTPAAAESSPAEVVESPPAEVVTETPPAEAPAELEYWDGSGFGARPVYRSGAEPHVSVALHDALEACGFSDDDADWGVDGYESSGSNWVVSNTGSIEIAPTDVEGVYLLKVDCS